MLASDIFKRVLEILQDNKARRWTLPELCMWINDALREIALQKPTAVSRTIQMDLDEGTLQALPEDYLSFIKPVRNMVGGKPGRTISTIHAATLDAQQPDWHSGRHVRFRPEVRHFVFDEADPRVFYCYPGNTGTGRIEVIAAREPDPVVPTGAGDAMSSYDVEMDIQSIYSNPIIDFVLFRAYAKDSQNAGAAQRAVLYYQQFANSLGIKAQVDGFSNPKYKAREAAV